MISERELLYAIKECESDPVTLSKVGKLADFYIIYEHLFGNKEKDMYSYSSAQSYAEEALHDSNFSKAVKGKDFQEVLKIFDELMEALKILNPRIYHGVLERLSKIS